MTFLRRAPAAFSAALFALTIASLMPARAAAPAAAADVDSIDAIIAAVYDVISGPAGEERNWDRFRSLFIDGARLIARAPQGPAGVVVMSPDDYVERAGASLVASGFFEREIGRTTEQYGEVMHTFSAYEARRAADDAEPFARGVNSFQLLHHGGRWWVVTIYWQSETPDNPIPEKYIGR